MDNFERNREKMKHLHAALMAFAQTATDEQALEFPTLYDEWKVGEAVVPGDRRYYPPTGKLYKVVQGHTTQADWTPDVTPALFVAIGLDDAGYPLWSQPTGAHDAYSKGDIVDYNGTLYESLMDGNTYSPEAYPAGWKEVAAE